MLRDAVVVGGPGGETTEVWITEGRVVAPESVPVGRAVSLAGRLVAPGLIDAHVHLCLDAGPDPLATFRAASLEALLALMRANAARALGCGVTTVRDLGAPTALIVALREEIGQGQTPGPRILASGVPLTAPRGHLHEMGGAVGGPGEARTAVRALRHGGADLVKVMATGGGSSPQTDPRAVQFSPEVLRTIVEEARAAGLPVAWHAHADAGIAQAVEAGVATIEHGSFASTGSLGAMASAGIALVPTLAPALAALAQPDLSPQRRRAIEERFDARREAVRRAYGLGVRLVAGTDAGVAHTAHGRVVEEVLALVACGLPPASALAAAWGDAAAALDRPDLGTLAPGAAADLIVLDGDPRDDPARLRQPLAVMQGGRWVRPLA